MKKDLQRQKRDSPLVSSQIQELYAVTDPWVLLGGGEGMRQRHLRWSSSFTHYPFCGWEGLITRRGSIYIYIYIFWFIYIDIYIYIYIYYLFVCFIERERDTCICICICICICMCMCICMCSLLGFRELRVRARAHRRLRRGLRASGSRGLGSSEGFRDASRPAQRVGAWVCARLCSNADSSTRLCVRPSHGQPIFASVCVFLRERALVLICTEAHRCKCPSGRWMHKASWSPGVVADLLCCSWQRVDDDDCSDDSASLDDDDDDDDDGSCKMRNINNSNRLFCCCQWREW